MVHMQSTTALYFQMEMHVLIILIEILNENHPSVIQHRNTQTIKMRLNCENQTASNVHCFHVQHSPYYVCETYDTIGPYNWTR